MKVIDLLNELANAPLDAEVILRKDGEGNGYSPLSGADLNCVYIPDSTWSGEVYSTDWTADEACKDEEEWANLLGKPKCVVLFPVN